MKNQLLFEAKRILLPLIVFTVIASVLYVLTALNSDFISVRYDFPGNDYNNPVEYSVPGNPITYIPASFLAILCFIVPVLQYSYRMKKRLADLWYALPLTRTRLMLLRTLGGLALVLLPYTVSYWLGFTAIALSENLFRLSAYVPLFFASIGIGILLYGVNSFLYTRANTVGDGIVFMLAWIVVPCFPFLFFLSKNFPFLPQGSLIESPILCSSLSPLGWLFSYFDTIIRGTQNTVPYAWFIFGLGAAAGAAAYFGLFFTAKRHKAENAEQLSSSAFGYKVLIPYCVALITAQMDVRYGSFGMPLASFAMVLIAGLILFFVYRRSFRLKKSDLISLGGSFAGGLVISLLCVAI